MENHSQLWSEKCYISGFEDEKKRAMSKGVYVNVHVHMCACMHVHVCVHVCVCEHPHVFEGKKGYRREGNRFSSRASRKELSSAHT